jgi:uncharacterized membrane protein YoaK (UPF0700 family)
VKRRPDVVRDGFLVVLAGCGGALDALSYLRLHAFTANMTGNTVLLGLGIGGRHLSDITHSAVAIAAFAVGAYLGTALGGEAKDDDPWPARVGRPFALEVVLVVAFALCWTAVPALAHDAVVLLALGACAMGVQSGITHDIHLGGASTTYMTGTIARTAEFFADTLRFGFRGGMLLNGITWIVYLVAAIIVGTLAASGANVGIIIWIGAAIIAGISVIGRPAVLRARES